MEIEFQFRAIEQQRWQEVRARRLVAEARRFDAEGAPPRVNSRKHEPAPSNNAPRQAPVRPA